MALIRCVAAAKVVITEELIGLKKGYLVGEVTSTDKIYPGKQTKQIEHGPLYIMICERFTLEHHDMLGFFLK